MMNIENIEHDVFKRHHDKLTGGISFVRCLTYVWLGISCVRCMYPESNYPQCSWCSSTGPRDSGGPHTPRNGRGEEKLKGKERKKKQKRKKRKKKERTVTSATSSHLMSTRLLPRKKVWRHLKNMLTYCQNNYKIMPLIILIFSITLFLTNQYSHVFWKEFIQHF